MNKIEKKLEVFKAALQQREEEIFHYQIDIDNFKRAIKKIEIEYEEDNDMKEFKKNLENLLQQNIAQQKRAQLIYDVVKEQLINLTEENVLR